jgi:hypothetical protein
MVQPGHVELLARASIVRFGFAAPLTARFERLGGMCDHRPAIAEP